MNVEFEVYYAKRWDPMVRLAYLLTGSSSEAEDLVQETFLAVATRWSQLESPDAFARRVLINRAHSHHRRRSMRRLPTEAEVAYPPEVDDTWTALKLLSPEHRSVVILRFYEDLTVDGIAEVLGCPSGTVKSRLHRALEQLKENLS